MMKVRVMSSIQLRSSSEAKSSQITLTDGYGKMNRRECECEAVIRFRKYKEEAEPSN